MDHRPTRAGRSRLCDHCAGRVVTMAKGRGRSHRGSAGRRGSARRGAGSSAGRSSSGAQSRPHRQAGGAGGSAARQGTGSSTSPRSGTGGNHYPQGKGRGSRTPGTKQTGHPLHSGQAGRSASGGRSGKPAQGGKGQGAHKGRAGKGPQGSQGSSTARSRQAAPGTAHSARTSSTQTGRSGRRRNGWGKGAQWAHIGGGRLTGAPDSVPNGPDQPRSGRLRKPIPPQPRYGLRRTLVLGGALLFLLLLVVAIIVGYFWVRGTIRGQDAERAAAQVRTVYPTPVTCDPSTLCRQPGRGGTGLLGLPAGVGLHDLPGGPDRATSSSPPGPGRRCQCDMERKRRHLRLRRRHGGARLTGKRLGLLHAERRRERPGHGPGHGLS